MSHPTKRTNPVPARSARRAAAGVAQVRGAAEDGLPATTTTSATSGGGAHPPVASVAPVAREDAQATPVSAEWRTYALSPHEIVEISALADRVNGALAALGVPPRELVDSPTLRYWRRPNVQILPPPVREDGGYGRQHFLIAVAARLRSVAGQATLAATRDFVATASLERLTEEIERLGRAPRPGFTEGSGLTDVVLTRVPRGVRAAQGSPVTMRVVTSGEAAHLLLPTTHPAWTDATARRRLLQDLEQGLRAGEA